MLLYRLMKGLESHLDCLDRMLLGAPLDNLEGQLSRDMYFFNESEEFKNDLLNIASFIERDHRVLLGRLFSYRSGRDSFNSRLLVSLYTPSPGAPLELLVCAQLLMGDRNTVQWYNHTGARLRVSEGPMTWSEEHGIHFQLEDVVGTGRWDRLAAVDVGAGEWLHVQRRGGLGTPDLRALTEAIRPIQGKPLWFGNKVVERVMVPEIDFAVGGKAYRTSPIYVRNTGREGLGVFAAQDLEGGAVVTMYFGKMINPERGRGGMGEREGTHYKALSLFGSAFAPGSVSGCCMDGAIQQEEGLTLEGYVTRSSVGSLMNGCEEREANCKMECSPGRCDKMLKYVPYDRTREPGQGEQVFCLLMRVKEGRPVRAGTQLKWHYRFDPHHSDAPYMNVDEGYAPL